jgi:hypothetical protein
MICATNVQIVMLADVQLVGWVKLTGEETVQAAPLAVGPGCGTRGLQWLLPRTSRRTERPRAATIASSIGMSMAVAIRPSHARLAIASPAAGHRAGHIGLETREYRPIS